MKHPILLLSVPLLLCLPSGWVLAAADITPADQSGCWKKCGNVDIPYPFGIGDQCAIHPGFGINCIEAKGTMKPFSGDFEVTKISVPDAKVWIEMDISWRCSDLATGQVNGAILSQNFTGTPFSFSHKDNKIFVIVTHSTTQYHRRDRPVPLTLRTLIGHSRSLGLLGSIG
ncbi:hypothetical protein EJB05_30802, partial [Eragrostis curvula]